MHITGDSYASAGMNKLANLIKEVHPGIYIHLVLLDENLEEDHRAGIVSIPSVLSVSTKFYFTCIGS